MMDQVIDMEQSIETAFIGTIKERIYHGSAVFQQGDQKFSSEIEIYTTSTKAYIRYSEPIVVFLKDESISFTGFVQKNIPILGKLYGRKNSTDGNCIASCSELQIGEVKVIHQIETTLMGCYFPNKFSFTYKETTITFLPSTTNLNVAKRTQSINHTILDGNKVVIEGESLSVTGVNMTLWVLCWLLRPVTASEIYYKQMICNNGKMIQYSPSTPSGRRFGMKENIAASTFNMPKYLKDGLEKWEQLSPFDRLTIKDAGYVLSNAEVLGYGELAIMPLFAAIERMGSNYDGAKPIPSVKVNKVVKDLKRELKKNAETYFGSIDESLTDEHKSNLRRSIANIKPYDDQVIQKLKRHLINKIWQMEIDIDVYKELRDHIMHSGVWPKKDEDCFDNDIEDYPNQKSKDLQDQLEVIMLIAVLDLVGYDGLIKMSKNGWRTYVSVSDVKKGFRE